MARGCADPIQRCRPKFISSANRTETVTARCWIGRRAGVSHELQKTLRWDDLRSSAMTAPALSLRPGAKRKPAAHQPRLLSLVHLGSLGGATSTDSDARIRREPALRFSPTRGQSTLLLWRDSGGPNPIHHIRDGQRPVLFPRCHAWPLRLSAETWRGRKPLRAFRCVEGSNRCPSVLWAGSRLTAQARHRPPRP